LKEERKRIRKKKGKKKEERRGLLGQYLFLIVFDCF
jgi:hypothetical protein